LEVCKKQNGECWQFGQWLCDHWHIAAITAWYAKGLCPICHSCENRSRVIAKFDDSGKPVLTSMYVLLYGLSL
jgi:hypothetical protein